MKAVFDLAKKYYPTYWSKERLNVLLAKKKLTQKEYDELTVVSKDKIIGDKNDTSSSLE
mgnify:CR=1 FL=1